MKNKELTIPKGVTFEKTLNAKKRREIIKEYFSYKKIWNASHLLDIYDNYKDQHSLEYKNYKKENSYGNYKPIEVIENILESADFVNVRKSEVSRNISKNIKDLKPTLKEMLKKQTSQLWAHPSGVLISLDSHSIHNRKHLFNSLHVYTQVDIGLGNLSSLQYIFGSSNGIQASRSVNLQYNGSQYANLSVHETVDGMGIINILDKIQKMGKIVPFNEWNISGSSLYFNPEYWMDRKDVSETFKLINKENDKTKDLYTKEKFDKYYLSDNGCVKLFNKLSNIFWDHIFDNLNDCEQKIHGLGRVLFSSMFNGTIKCNKEQIKNQNQNVIKNNKKTHNKKYISLSNEILSNIPEEFNYYAKKYYDNKNYTKYHFNERADLYAIEDPLKLIEEVNSYSCNKYLNEKDKLLINNWFFNIFKYFKNPNDRNNKSTNKAINLEKDFSIEENLTGGINLATLLLTSCIRKKQAIGVFLQLIERVSSGTLKKWCSTPDVTGRTLMQHIIRFSLKKPFFNDEENILLNNLDTILDKINKKCYSNEWVLETDNFSPNGEWLKSFSKDFTENKIHCETIYFNEFKKVMKNFINLGCSVSEKYIWSNEIGFEKIKGEYDNDKYMINDNNIIKSDSLKDAFVKLPPKEKKDKELLKYILELEINQENKIERHKKRKM